MEQATLSLLINSIKTIPDYPQPGIMFRDITSLIEDPIAFSTTIDILVKHYKDKKIDKVVGAEARGFIFGAPIAAAIGAGFVPARKPGKLPRATVNQTYELEYGTDMLQIHSDAITEGERVLLIDDLLATGGTLDATVKLIRKLGGVVDDAAVVIELPALKGREKLESHGVELFSIIEFEGE